MKLDRAHSLAELSAILECKFTGNPEHKITGINEIHVVEPGDLVFVDHPKYYEKALKSKATTILINKEVDCPEGKGLLISSDPFMDFNKLTKHFNQKSNWNQSPARIGDGTRIMANVHFGSNVHIGENCTIYPGTVIGDNVIIGDRVIIQANSVIGGHAFYYQKREGKYHQMNSCGRVILEDDVEIGALCSIDSGVTGDTIIGKGSKLDNQVHVGHDTKIGKNCLFAAQVGLAGCVTVENHVTLWGQVGVASNLIIGEGAVVLGQSGLSKSLAGNKTYLGSPVDEARIKFRELAALRKLPAVIENL